MADEYYAEPALADVLQRNALDPSPPQLSWEFQKPLLKDFLLNALTLAPMGFRPGGMMPPRAIPRGSTDPGITGGVKLSAETMREYPGIREMVMRDPAARNSSVGLTSEVAPDAFWSTSQPLSYPRFQYQGRGAVNEKTPITAEMQKYYDALLRQQRPLKLVD